VLCGDILVPKDRCISVANAAETPAISNAAANVIEICLFMTVISTIAYRENALGFCAVRFNSRCKMQRGLLPRQ
jgi:hypothetical protein